MAEELTREQKVTFLRMRYDYLVSQRVLIQHDIEDVRDRLAELGEQP